MSAPPPNPPSFSSHHPVRHHQPSSQSALSTPTPVAAAGVDASLSSSSVPGTHASSYHHSSSYATAPSDTPIHPHHLSASLGTAIHSSASSASLAHMARLQSHFSQLAPSCSAHLADQNAVPILSTTPHPGSQGLSNLSQAFVTAHDTASRLGLGVPLRVTLTTGNGAAVIQSGVLPDVGGSEDEDGSRSGVMGRNGGDGGMMLVGTVIAPGDRLAEARIASWGVEDVARKFQRYMCDGK